MKRKNLTICTFLCFIIGAGNAQINKLLDFNGANGSYPYGSLTLSGGVLYGMTAYGGANGGGKIFSINKDGSGYTSLLDFSDTMGYDPMGSLTLSEGKMYGVCSRGAKHGEGSVFSVNTDGSGYSTIHAFEDSTGGFSPYGSVLLSGNVLYGMTQGGGSSEKGVIFSVNTDGTAFAVVFNFNGVTGSNPTGDLTLSGNILYGMTPDGGMNSKGNIFSINTDGSGYKDLLDFNGTNGSAPNGSLTLSGNVLYGLSDAGGLNSKGTVFSIHTDGSGYQDLFDFNGANGSNPDGSLNFQTNVLYGTTSSGGLNGMGNLFSINTDGSNYTDVADFSGINGDRPQGNLTVAGVMLYGLTTLGGVNGDGVVFSYKNVLVPSICMVTVDENSNYNDIIWQTPVSTSIDSFIVYREITANNYEQIGAVAYTTLSEFVDTVARKYFPFTGNPNAGTFRYKIQVRDTGGNYGQLSLYHNTIYTIQTSGTFNWNQYEIEGEPIPIPELSAYVLYRDDNSTGNWQPVQGVSASQTTVTDPNYSSYPNGSWRVETSWGITCTPAARTLQTFNSSLSNIAGKKVSTGIAMLNDAIDFSMYPNPNNGKLFIEVLSSEKQYLQVSDVNGKILLSQNIENGKSMIDANDLCSGIYNVSITNTNQRVNKRLVIVK